MRIRNEEQNRHFKRKFFLEISSQRSGRCFKQKLDILQLTLLSRADELNCKQEFFALKLRCGFSVKIQSTTQFSSYFLKPAQDLSKILFNLLTPFVTAFQSIQKQSRQNFKTLRNTQWTDSFSKFICNDEIKSLSSALFWIWRRYPKLFSLLSPIKSAEFWVYWLVLRNHAAQRVLFA